MTHSFRSLIWGSIAALLAVISLASQSMAAPGTPDLAQRQPYPQPMRKLPNANDFVLTWDNTDASGTPYQNLIRQLRAGLGFNATEYTNPNEFLAAARKHATRNCPQAMQGNTGALRRNTARVVTQNWFCLEREDATVRNNLNEPRWIPQGISGTWDSSAQGTVNRARAFAFSWHYTNSNEKNHAARVTLLGENAPYRYDDAMLVEPITSGGTASFANLHIHTGGLIWYKQYLLATDDHTGIYVFDMHNMLDLRGRPNANTTNTNRIGLETNGIYYTGGFPYILPLVGVWRSQPSEGEICHPEGIPPCYTYAGLDRSTSPPTMLTGEWCPRTSVRCTVGRVARWRMQPESSNCVRGCLEYTGRTARAGEAYTQVHNSMQGGISWNGVYQFTRSTNPTSLGRRYSATPGQTPTPHFAGKGVQDLYWQRSTSSPNPILLWSLTEYPGEGNNIGKRVLYGVTP